MTLTFANFKQEISSHILARGRDYYASGHVIDLEFDDESAWSAQVEGTEIYDVEIEQAAQGYLVCECTCPYDMGEHCKHIAAILYAIEESFPEVIGKKQTVRKKRQTKYDKLRDALQNTPHSRLVDILLELAEKDKQLNNRLMVRLDVLGESSRDYRSIISDALRAGQREYGFIDYRGSMQAASKIFELLNQTGRMLAEGQVSRAIAVFQAVLEKVTVAIAHADDSSGSLGSCIAVSVEGLEKCIPLLNTAERHSLFEYCCQQAQKPEFRDWDWGWDLFAIAAELVADESDRETLFAALDSLVKTKETSAKKDFFRDFTLERAAQVKLSVIERFDGREAGLAFIRAHVHLSRFRQMLIERLIDANTLDEASQLAREGVILSEKNRFPGLVLQYRALQLVIAQKRRDADEIIRIASELWLQRGGNEYYEVLKNTIPEKDWSGFFESLIDRSRHSPHMLAWAFVREDMWERLLGVVQEHPELIRDYRKELEKRFPDKIAQVYERIVEKMLHRTSDRGTYRMACEYLIRMKQLGAGTRVSEVVQSLKTRYGNRRALIEELGKV